MNIENNISSVKEIFNYTKEAEFKRRSEIIYKIIYLFFRYC